MSSATLLLELRATRSLLRDLVEIAGFSTRPSAGILREISRLRRRIRSIRFLLNRRLGAPRYGRAARAA